MEDELAAVGVGEEILAEERDQCEHQQAGQQEAGNEDVAPEHKLDSKV